MGAYILAVPWTSDISISPLVQPSQADTYVADAEPVGCLPDFWAAYLQRWTASCLPHPFMQYVWF